MRDISTNGIGMILNHDFERGTVLLLEIASPGNQLRASPCCCVIHSTPQGEGRFLCGCILAERLSETELRTILRMDLPGP
jgi:hypothetical protein